jgi:hypothetical protein
LEDGGGEGQNLEDDICPVIGHGFGKGLPPFNFVWWAEFSDLQPTEEKSWLEFSWCK